MRHKSSAKKSLCQDSPETPEQKKIKPSKIIFDASDNLVISTILAINMKSKNSFKATPSSLSLDKILNICSAEWGVGEDHFKGKIVHSDRRDKLIKTSLLWAHFYFSNEEVSTATEFVGCTNTMGWNCRDFIYYAIQYKDNYSRVLLNIAHACNAATNKRLYKLNYAQLSDLKCHVSDWGDGLDKLDQYQRSKIPLRDEAWIRAGHDRGNNFSIIMASLSSSEQLYCSLSDFSRDIPVLMQLQSQDWRLYHPNTREAFWKSHPICDKCFNKNSCKNKGGSRLFSLLMANVDDPFSCFVEPSDQPLKIDIELLYALPSYMLQ